MLSKKHRQALRSADRRRANRPVPQIVPIASLKASGSLENRMIRGHQDVLQNIEFALVSSYREGDNIDDKVVEDALQAAIRGREPEDPAAEEAFCRLAAIRQMREDVPDELWTDGLRVVYSSVRRHSECRPGQTSYLDFVSPYVL